MSKTQTVLENQIKYYEKQIAFWSDIVAEYDYELEYERLSDMRFKSAVKHLTEMQEGLIRVSAVLELLRGK